MRERHVDQFLIGQLEEAMALTIMVLEILRRWVLFRDRFVDLDWRRHWAMGVVGFGSTILLRLRKTILLRNFC